MEIKELRIGNRVKQGIITAITYSDGILGCIIADSIFSSNLGEFYPAKGIEPIPLTEGLLIKFGFKTDRFGWTFYHPNNAISINLLRRGDDFGLSNSNYVNIKYVHQLQNLVFALFGEELEIN